MHQTKGLQHKYTKIIWHSKERLHISCSDFRRSKEKYRKDFKLTSLGKQRYVHINAYMYVYMIWTLLQTIFY